VRHGSHRGLAEEHNLFVIEIARRHTVRVTRDVRSIERHVAPVVLPDKIITTGGEGGMVTTNDRALWSRMWVV